MKLSGPPTEAQLCKFVYDEARLIDEKRLDEWYDLFTEDAYYWMPLTRDQPDGVNFTSLLYEDKLLLKVRVERLKKPNSFSQQQPSFCQHVLQQPEVVSSDADASLYITRAPFMYFETQLDEHVVLAGVVHHHLVVQDGTLRIRLKKVEIVNCDAALPAIQLFP